MAGSDGIVMFMAIDIVGSSEFKLRSGSERDEAFWLEPFERFFQRTPLRFIGRVAEASAHRASIPASTVWRVRGDEIIFLSRLYSPDDARLLSTAFLNTVADCDELILRDWDLKVRGCCWAAQLSGRNRVITIPEMHQGFVDYLGPDVDAGFRLSACAPNGQVAYSYNLIHLLSGLREDVGARFRYVEDRVLKGVAKQLPYPIVTSAASSQSDPEGFPDDASAVVSKVDSGHPTLDALKETLVQF